MKIKEISARSILTKSNLPDADFVINPYVGCSYACIYCYADFMRRFSGHSDEGWGEFVDVKVNAAETINASKLKAGHTVVIGSVTDPYQACEAKYKITRKCLEKLSGTKANIEIITKSPLVLRDVDLLKKFENLRVGISVGTLDEKMARGLEPRAASPMDRINVLKQLHEAGIETFLFVSPIFPEISNVDSLIDLTKDFVDEFLFENLNIRADNRKRIFEFLEGNAPELVELYSGLSRDYWEGIREKIIAKCEKEALKYKMYFYHGK